MPGSVATFRERRNPSHLLSNFQCNFPIDLRLDEFHGDGRQVLYIREKRFLNRELLDFGDTKLQFGDPPSEAFLFNLNVVVRQVVDFFDGGFDDIWLSSLKVGYSSAFESHQLP